MLAPKVDPRDSGDTHLMTADACKTKSFLCGIAAIANRMLQNSTDELFKNVKKIFPDPLHRGTLIQAVVDGCLDVVGGQLSVSRLCHATTTLGVPTAHGTR